MCTDQDSDAKEGVLKPTEATTGFYKDKYF